ncbi:methyltransferase domain-containing protein [Nitrosophilus alvini]|uniref:methyltransferase domain-containing protein n=1 Tax=Nitrosophilus alvini TaxID=2714855 RepID=UPI0019099E00|nr:methyltransferase domain-containing protein [Nitrosophilus alvini]
MKKLKARYKMNPVKEFSRFAEDYQSYKIIQSRVAKELVALIDSKPKNILDIGAGSGEIYKNIDWEFDRFYALDKSEKMLNLHPDFKTQKLLCDFNNYECYKNLKNRKIDFIFSSSSLQWAENLDNIFENISFLSKKIAFAIFTDKTFETLHKTAGIKSPIFSGEEILNSAKKFFMINYRFKSYRLFFKDSRSMFSYIKRSGVSAGERRLSFKETKRLFREYPLKYLEFEVLFIWTE